MKRLTAEEIIKGIEQLDSLSDIKRVAEAVRARVKGVADELLEVSKQ